jgi:transposase-like protein
MTLDKGLASRVPVKHYEFMKKNDVICPDCRAGFQRIEISSRRGERGEYRCPVCDTLLEVFDGSTKVACRLTVQPEVRNRS